MALSYKARRRWSLVLLLVWLPVYVILVIGFIGIYGERLPLWLEVVFYPVLGIAWVLPFRKVFRGVGRDKSQNGE